MFFFPSDYDKSVILEGICDPSKGHPADESCCGPLWSTQLVEYTPWIHVWSSMTRVMTYDHDSGVDCAAGVRLNDKFETYSGPLSP